MPRALGCPPQNVPKVLRNWIENPVPDRKLGEKILDEMKTYMDILGYLYEIY